MVSQLLPVVGFPGAPVIPAVGNYSGTIITLDNNDDYALDPTS